jgi:hypothetical protein
MTANDDVAVKYDSRIVFFKGESRIAFVGFKPGWYVEAGVFIQIQFAPQGIGRHRHQVGDAGGVHQIDRSDRRPTTKTGDLGGHLLGGPGGTVVVDEHVGPGLRQADCQRPAHPDGPSGNHRHPPGQFHLRRVTRRCPADVPGRRRLARLSFPP